MASTQAEAALIDIQRKRVVQAELQNMITLSQLPEYDEYSDDIKARIIRLGNLRKNAK